MSGDFAVHIKVKNGRLLQAILDAGYENVRQFCLAEGFCQSQIGRLLNFKESPLNTGQCEWTSLAKRLSECLGPLPDELFPEHLQIILASNEAVHFTNHEQMRAIVDDSTAGTADRDHVRRLLSVAKLNPRELHAVEAVVVDGDTLDTVADRLGVTRERARQIQLTGLHKLREADNRTPPWQKS